MSNELEAFIEYITVIRALSKKSVEAYQSDLNALEENIQKIKDLDADCVSLSLDGGKAETQDY